MNITLIGMAGAGKSTVGRVLAKRLGYDFVDIDAVLEAKHGRPLQELLDEAGDEAFLHMEREVALSYQNGLQNTVISTGGSMVYSPAAMEHLKKISKIVFLDASLDDIKKRITVGGRGIVGGRDKPFEEVYAERLPLYKRYADIVVPMSGSIEDNAEQVLLALAD